MCVPTLASPDMNYQMASIFSDILILLNLVSKPRSYFIYYHYNLNFKNQFIYNFKQISEMYL